MERSQFVLRFLRAARAPLGEPGDSDESRYSLSVFRQLLFGPEPAEAQSQRVSRKNCSPPPGAAPACHRENYDPVTCPTKTRQ